MVTNVTNFSRSGLSDWLVQQVSAVILALYALLMVGYFLFHPGLDYATWHGFFSQTWMRIFSLLAFIALAAHVWVGVWTVITDYIKPIGIRFAAQIVLILAIFVFLVWGVQILWGA
ncbi:succinate dehydrogenase subunit D [Modicisalibacter ilicicola DSM 19980]|uniref:Succinate dehydrogenase hydrophobic membrane anchor subunit n=1 Tax=Modicisalibacter ilicicola DSM 19980 TaxID=1121942 RepID=A0A1M4Y640_9GAMM|nr:succinate dehydrogenase, hydrophobic membrane anchor protein [Halomonas ilicicola]SHF01096.1 succinate dehydrogenase subunit D [Halomonas ilicicola DSM 19980]